MPPTLVDGKPQVSDQIRKNIESTYINRIGFFLFSFSCFLTFINDYINEITILENGTKLDSFITFLSISVLLALVSIEGSKAYSKKAVKSITIEDIEKNTPDGAIAFSYNNCQN